MEIITWYSDIRNSEVLYFTIDHDWNVNPVLGGVGKFTYPSINVAVTTEKYPEEADFFATFSFYLLDTTRVVENQVFLSTRLAHLYFGSIPWEG